MAKIKCERCGDRFDKDSVVDEFDEKYGYGTYYYLYPVNEYCLDCAEELYEEDDDDDGPPRGCRECGGNWPECTASCPLYDD